MRDDKFGQVEDYTEAFLWMAYLVLVSGLVMIWGLWGYPMALIVCACLHYGIKRLGLHRARVEADWDARVAAALDRARRK
ncbi:hypothetical protein JANAI62_15170 [Jannaschia pagri]|uniref:Uncharacterized protein n=1 Tax=Jannaschia pagri TaxID=2829797 RepID=A0ABQ4NKH5_9RHOB|nr:MULTISPECIES: hypothetical protein [unclassified Jannaschia]GIT91062.1 hypothetical protein JANAI61_15200 [Jannaschia sp. AI_61]GIT94894.1 hypothetical protein JANAI62_15170 [Jannaschia sp. AI_62]